jgi:hypothetical protein
LLGALILSCCFAVVQFLYYNSPGVLSYPDDCDSLWNCFKFSVSYGRSGDFGEDMTQRLNNEWLFYFAFDVAIRFVLLNVIRGITVDTFSELREEKLERLKDTFETCFICGMDKQVFDRDKASRGFTAHIRSEHNMWNYLYFIIYIWEQDKDDDDGLEQFVRRSIDSNDISWLPTNKAMCLSESEDNDEEITRKLFQRDVANLQANFTAKISDFQTGIFTKIMEIEGLMMLDNPGMVQMTSSILAKQASQEEGEPPIVAVQRSDSNMNPPTGKRVMIEISEISGLSFSSRTLDSMTCVVRSQAGVERLEASHVMHRANAPSLILFDPVHIVVDDNYEASKQDGVVTIQIARGVSGGEANVYVGSLNVSIKELVQADGSILQKSFEGRVLSSTCRGYLTIAVTIVEEEE